MTLPDLLVPIVASRNSAKEWSTPISWPTTVLEMSASRVVVSLSSLPSSKLATYVETSYGFIANSDPSFLVVTLRDFNLIFALLVAVLEMSASRGVVSLSSLPILDLL